MGWAPPVAFAVRTENTAPPARRFLPPSFGGVHPARGAVELIIANIALRAGLFALSDPPPPHVANLFSAVVIMAVVTTMTTPFALKWVFAQRGSRWRR